MINKIILIILTILIILYLLFSIVLLVILDNTYIDDNFEDDEYDNACREYEEAYKKYKRAELKFKHINHERFVKKAVEAVKGTIER